MRKIHTLFAVLMLGGCTAAPPADPGLAVAVPGSEIAAPRGDSPPVLRPQGPLTLADAIAMALASNPDVAAASFSASLPNGR